MNHLSHEEQEKILDFYFRCGEQEEINGGRDLIASNPEAARLYANLEETLTDLDQIKYEPCPDNLVDLTIARLKLAASVKNKLDSANTGSQLHQLLEKEQQALPETPDKPYYQPQDSDPTLKFNPHHRMGELLAAAASIIVIFSLLIPIGGAMRNAGRKITCQNNLSQVGAAFSAFANDHADQIAAARIPAGNPWWKIGDQSAEANSNTRHPWQLVKLGYVTGDAFICKGDVNANPIDCDNDRMKSLYDFPCRTNVSYSFMLFCDKNANALQKSRKIITSDANPHFQNITPCQSNCQPQNEFEKVVIDDQYRQIMSANHRGKGQNILYCDGSVDWLTVRIIAHNSTNDDIFTIQGVSEYKGCETPANDNDTFLAP